MAANWQRGMAWTRNSDGSEPMARAGRVVRRARAGRMPGGGHWCTVKTTGGQFTMGPHLGKYFT